MLVVLIAAFVGFTSPALAQGLAQPGKSWVQVASQRDLNAAIGIARHFPGDPSARVVVAANGWYAVVIGPVVENTVPAFRMTHPYFDLPSDAFTVRGDAYVLSAWEPKSPVLAEAHEKTPAKWGDLTIALAVTNLGRPNARITVTGRTAAPLFALDIPAANITDQFETVTAEIVRLDKATRYPQVVVTGYTGGAHCCTATWVLTESAGGRWSVLQAATLDGGYQLEDIDADGAAELVSLDNSFLYAFDAYAASFAPVNITRLAGGALVDATRAPAMRNRHLQEVAVMEFQAQLDPGLWRMNGFLAGWVAQKALAGQLFDGWVRAMPTYDRSNTGFGKDVCASGAPLDKCPQNQIRTLPFPDGLALQLVEGGYGPLPAGLPGLTRPVPISR